MKTQIQQVGQYSLHIELAPVGELTCLKFVTQDSTSRRPEEPRVKLEAFLTDQDLNKLKGALLEYSLSK